MSNPRLYLSQTDLYLDTQAKDTLLPKQSQEVWRECATLPDQEKIRAVPNRGLSVFYTRAR